MESRGTLTSSKYNGVSAVVVYEGGQLIVSTKPAWVSYVFGVVGEALAPAKERFRINISEVISASFSETWTGKSVAEIFTATDTIKLTLTRNDYLAETLQRDLSEAGVC